MDFPCVNRFVLASVASQFTLAPLGECTASSPRTFGKPIPMPEVVSLGELLIDLFGRPAGVALKDATSFIPSPGGAPANVAVALARLGVDVGFIGGVGDDPFGEGLTDILRSEGVDVAHLRMVSESPTMIALVATASPVDQDFTIYRGADMKLKPEDLDRDYITSAKALLYGSVTLSGGSAAAALQAVRWANDKDVLVAYDANLRPAVWPSLAAAREGILGGMRGVDVCKLNETEVELIAGTREPAGGSRWVLDQGTKLCLITLGAEGTYFNNGRSEGHVPGFSVDAVDTTGCGDAFCAGLTVGLLEAGESVEDLGKSELSDIVCFANAVSAISATQTGAMAGLPRRDEVDEFLQERVEGRG